MLKKGLSLFFQVLSRMNFEPKYWLIGWESYYFRTLLVSHVCKAFTSHFTEIEKLILTNWVKNGEKKQNKTKPKELKRRWNSQRLFLGQFSRASCLMSGYNTLKETYVFEFLSVTIEHQKLRGRNWLRVRRRHAQFFSSFSLICVKFNLSVLLNELQGLSARLFFAENWKTEKKTDTLLLLTA